MLDLILQTRNLCSGFSPFPTIQIVWALVGSATIICYIIGWWFGRNQAKSKIIPSDFEEKHLAVCDNPVAMKLESVSSYEPDATTIHNLKEAGCEKPAYNYTIPEEKSRISPQGSRALRNVTSDQVRQAVASTGAAFFMDQDDSEEAIVQATTIRGDWLARNQFRIKFVIQTLIALYVFIWTILLISQMAAQSKLCAATGLCSAVIFPLGVVAFAGPGFIICFLIVTCSIRNLARKHLRQRHPTMSRKLMLFILTSIFIASSPLAVLGGIVFGGPVWLFLFTGWFVGRWSRWVDRKMWPIMCLLSCVATLITNIPLSILVSWLYYDGYDISASSVESNALIFLANLVGHAFAFCNFALSIHMRKDIWSTFYRLLTGDPSLQPWHVYAEQVHSEAYCKAFPHPPKTQSAGKEAA